MKNIIYNIKLKKFLIVTLIVMILINFVMPYTINYVYAAVYKEEQFWPNDPNNPGQSIDPDLLSDDYKNNTDWEYEDWDKSETAYQIVVGDATGFSQNPDFPYDMSWLINLFVPEEQETNYNTTSVTVAVSAYNNSLKESYDWNQEHSNPTEKIKLIDALHKAIDAAVASRK